MTALRKTALQRSGLKLAALAGMCLAAGVMPARAQTAPAGALFDLAVTHPTALTTYTQFNFNFTAATTATDVSWWFREVPAYFAFDDVSVTDTTHPSGNLLSDPGFESSAGDVLTNFPGNGWDRFIQAIDTTAIGVVATTTQTYGCNVGAHSGTVFWCDGSVQGYDGLDQDIATTVGDTYNVSFWLEDDSNEAITNPTIDVLAYAGAGLPIGAIPIGTPEPASLLMLGAGLAGIAFVRRRRRA